MSCLFKLAVAFSAVSAILAAPAPTISERLIVRTSNPPPSHTSLPNADGRYWPGWAGIAKYFPFGDSYSSTLYNLSGVQPGLNAPLGNPQPYGPGSTSSNGPNYVDYLTTVYNQSFIETYDLAFGGATVDAKLIPPFLPVIQTFRQQVHDEFLPYYITLNLADNWTSSNSLFSFFFGINDVGNSYAQRNATLNAAVFATYASLVDQLYQVGARNFLFINVPPVDRSPGTLALGAATQKLEGADIAAFNLGLERLATNLSLTYADATVFQFNANALFTQVLDEPSSYSQTALYRNTTEYCGAYQGGTPTRDYFNESCGVPVNRYFWLNTLHPTYPMHDAMAQQIVAELTS